MDYKIIISSMAQHDFDMIQNYLMNEIGQTYATKIRRAMIEKLKTILKQPMLYQIMEEAKYKKENIRRIPVEGYCIFYKVNEMQKQINIARIRSDKQDNKSLNC